MKPSWPDNQEPRYENTDETLARVPNPAGFVLGPALGLGVLRPGLAAVDK